MSKPKSKARRIWSSAQLYVAFHRTAEGKRREVPHVWPPKKARATIHPDPRAQEVFVLVKNAEGDVAQDIQIKLQPDRIVLRRDQRTTWKGVVIDAHSVQVKVADITIRINPDGSITREDGDSTTWVEADGGVLKKTELVEAAVSPDGMEMTRRTPDNLVAITPQGLLSKDR